jgi:hypothetical protein
MDMQTRLSHHLDAVLGKEGSDPVAAAPLAPPMMNLGRLTQHAYYKNEK